MNPSKIQILIWFIKLRLSRLFSSNSVPKNRRNNWRKNLSKSLFYNQLIKSNTGFPIMDKSKFMQEFDQINTVGITKKEAFDVALKSETSRDFSPSINGISIGLSSGTSGNKGIFLTGKREKEIWVGAILDRVIGFSLKKRKVAFFLRANNNLYESVNSQLIEFHFYDLALPFTELLNQFTQSKYDIVVAQPSVLNELANYYEANELKANINKIISVAEVLEEDQKKYFETIFSCNVEQVYQCTEGFLAYTCKSGNLHFNNDWLLIEKKYIDESKTRFHPVITDYMRTSQPIVKYELNDIIHEGGACSCGSKAMVIKKIEGRSDDVFKYKKGEKTSIIYPDFIRRAVLTCSDLIENYTVTKISEKRIEVALETSKNTTDEIEFEKVKEGLLNLFNSHKISDIEITLVPFRHQFINKFKRIRNEHQS